MFRPIAIRNWLTTPYGQKVLGNLKQCCSVCCTGPAAPTDHIYTPRNLGVGNGGGRRVRQGSISPVPNPLDSTPTQFFFLQSYFEKTTTYASYFSIMSSIILSPYLTFDVTPSVITKINSGVRTCLQGSTKAG